MKKASLTLWAFLFSLFLWADESKPNVVFVLFDDFGYGQPPSYRKDSPFKTPNVDRLAEQGIRFTDAHSAAANCTPTRYGVLTGRYPSRIGQFGVLKTYSKPIIPKTRLTVASFLKGHGYHTACIGKWHLGMNWVDVKKGKSEELPIGARMTDGPNALGFDYFYGFTHARNIGGIIEQDKVVANVKGIENQPMMIKKALEYLDARAKEDKPFFLYFPVCPPHSPIVPAEEFVGKSGMQGKEGKYGDWVYQGDHMLGRIMEALERNGQAENTLIIATGDNGAAGRSYEPLRDNKSSIYEGGAPGTFRGPMAGKNQTGFNERPSHLPERPLRNLRRDPREGFASRCGRRQRKHIAGIIRQGQGTDPRSNRSPGSRGFGHPPGRLEIDRLEKRNERTLQPEG